MLTKSGGRVHLRDEIFTDTESIKLYIGYIEFNIFSTYIELFKFSNILNLEYLII